MSATGSGWLQPRMASDFLQQKVALATHLLRAQFGAILPSHPDARTLPRGRGMT